MIPQIAIPALLISSCLVSVGCSGGGGDSTPPVTIPAELLEGTYDFRSAVLTCSDGTTITDADFTDLVIGTLEVTELTWHQEFIIGDEIFNQSGSYETTFTSGNTEGFFTVITSQGPSTIFFTLNGLELTLSFVSIITQPGLSCDEVDIWVKTSDQVGGALISGEEISSIGNHVFSRVLSEISESE